MPKKSSKENKNIYFQRREELNLTRDKASELLETIPSDRIEKIENERVTPYPDEVLLMSEKYKSPEFCNYFCTHQCAIGEKYVDELKIEDLSKIVLQVLSSLNSVQKNQSRLIEIAADGKIEGDEIKDFISIQKALEKISLTVDTLELWTEHMLANGSIDPEEYLKYTTE